MSQAAERDALERLDEASRLRQLAQARLRVALVLLAVVVVIVLVMAATR